ncbi:hypothetical protein [Aporhodopirellula aestuarii]|uniref:Large ribosomal subunit protein bL25 beta domain-containing protein n=1 Tax=Aporhodopirellula aestuarii TaxID=2950107 RepID=A0ABT0TYS5_9BACT|nr:hypothetical protein [Aporhodopirellula aestuarii]MCM2369748.1 hypothetical protein [Aporhodopirellula aestuarii]
MIEKELPIKVSFGGSKKPKRYNQHIKRVRVYGHADDFPEQLELDAADIFNGGVLTIDDLPLPEDFEVVDRRDSDPIITVEKQKKDKRGSRDSYDD